MMVLSFSDLLSIPIEVRSPHRLPVPHRLAVPEQGLGTHSTCLLVEHLLDASIKFKAARYTHANINTDKKRSCVRCTYRRLFDLNRSDDDGLCMT